MRVATGEEADGPSLAGSYTCYKRGEELERNRLFGGDFGADRSIVDVMDAAGQKRVSGGSGGMEKMLRMGFYRGFRN